MVTASDVLAEIDESINSTLDAIGQTEDEQEIEFLELACQTLYGLRQHLRSNEFMCKIESRKGAHHAR